MVPGGAQNELGELRRCVYVCVAINSSASFIEYTVQLSPWASSTDANTYSVLTHKSQDIIFICSFQEHVAFFFGQKSLVKNTDLVEFTVHMAKSMVTSICPC